MHVDHRPVRDVVVLDLHGKITAGEGDVSIRDAIQALARGGVRKVVLNFQDVPYMDSVGLSTIVRAQLAVGQHGGRLKLLHVPRRIADLLAVTRLADVFETFDDESAVVRSFDAVT
jgi:anti-sigma B factor antagonist